MNSKHTALHALTPLTLATALALALAGCGGGDNPDVQSNPDASDAQSNPDTQSNPDVQSNPDTGTDAPIGGNDCATYCTQITTNCTGSNAQYADMADCMAYCGSVMWPAGTAGAQSGNTLACRIYHGGAPAASMPALHCPHAGPTGAGVCGTPMFRTEASAMYTRVDRMGMPAVATALVASARRNAYNDADPAGDMAFATDFITSLTTLHGALDDDLNGLHLTPCSMVTLVNGLPECLGQEYAPGHTVASLVVPNDVIHIDPSAAAGFPNGRRLQDPVIDVTLAVLFLRLGTGTCGSAACSAATLAGVPLNPPRNDVAAGMFLSTFPYLQPAQSP